MALSSSCLASSSRPLRRAASPGLAAGTAGAASGGFLSLFLSLLSAEGAATKAAARIHASAVMGHLQDRENTPTANPSSAARPDRLPSSAATGSLDQCTSAQLEPRRASTT